MTALQKLPADRWGSAREFSDALTGAGSRSGSMRHGSDGRPRGLPPAAPRAALVGRLGIGGRRRRGRRLGAEPAAARAPAVPARHPGAGPGRERGELAAAPPGVPPGRADAACTPSAARTATLRLVRHALDAEAGTPIENAVGMGSPLVSPDGRWILGTQAVTRQVLRLPLDGGSQELVSSSLSTSDAAFAPDGKLWYSSDADLGTVEGDSLVARLHKGGYHLLQILDDGRSALTVRTRVGNAAGPDRAGGSRDRGRDTDPEHAGHRGEGDPGTARVRDGRRYHAGRAVRSGPAAGSAGRR